MYILLLLLLVLFFIISSSLSLSLHLPIYIYLISSPFTFCTSAKNYYYGSTKTIRARRWRCSAAICRCDAMRPVLVASRCFKKVVWPQIMGRNTFCPSFFSFPFFFFFSNLFILFLFLFLISCCVFYMCHMTLYLGNDASNTWNMNDATMGNSFFFFSQLTASKLLLLLLTYLLLCDGKFTTASCRVHSWYTYVVLRCAMFIMPNAMLCHVMPCYAVFPTILFVALSPGQGEIGIGSFFFFCCLSIHRCLYVGPCRSHVSFIYSFFFFLVWDFPRLYNLYN